MGGPLRQRSTASYLTAAVIAACVVAAPGSADAQDHLPLSEVLLQLLGNTIIVEPTSLPDQPSHLAHFRPGPDQLEVPGQFNRALLTLLSTYPVASPSGGFTYTFDPALGTFRRTSESFGPTFAERALTIGRGRVSVGFGYQHATYDTFEGLNLRQRGVTFYVPHIDCCGVGGAMSQPDDSRLTPAFEGDLMKAELALDLSTDASIFAVNYGIRDRFDIGVVVPFLHVTMDASVLATIDRLSTAAEPEIHAFPGPNPDTAVFRASGSASGLGDIVVRSKYLLFPAAGGGLAAALDVRVPTGDESNLLGTGGVQTRLYAVGIAVARTVLAAHQRGLHVFEPRRAARHTPARRDHRRGGVRSRVDPARHHRRRHVEPLAAGRRADAPGRQDLQLRGGSDRRGRRRGGGGGGGGSGGGSRPVAETLTAVRTELKPEPGNLNLAFGSASVRFSPWRSVLITAGLLFPLTDAGLRDRVTPIIGIDYGF